MLEVRTFRKVAVGYPSITDHMACSGSGEFVQGMIMSGPYGMIIFPPVDGTGRKRLNVYCAVQHLTSHVGVARRDSEQLIAGPCITVGQF